MKQWGWCSGGEAVGTVREVGESSEVGSRKYGAVSADGRSQIAEFTVIIISSV